MKYISFLGSFNYHKTKYVEEDNLIVRYFQNVILHRHQNDFIDDLFIVTTKEGEKKHYSAMCDEIRNNYPDLSIKKIIVKDEDNYEEVVKTILKEVKDSLNKQEFIMDITHCYRTMPTKILLTLDYLEKIININVKHLYYGKVNEGKEIVDSEEIYAGEVIDFIKFYQESKIAESLRQFKETLKLTNEDTFFEDNTVLSDMLSEMRRLNDYLELADYNNTEKCMKKILYSSKQLKNMDGMKRIKMYLEDVYHAFEELEKTKNDIDSLCVIVDILCSYKYYQLACTFIYKMYEKWLEDHLFVKPENGELFKCKISCFMKDFKKSNEVLDKVDKEGLDYNSNLLNQLANHYRDYDEESKYPFVDSLTISDEDYLVPHVCYESYVCIEHFVTNVRNPLNHAQILRITEVNKEFNLMLSSIKRLYKVVGKYDI